MARASLIGMDPFRVMRINDPDEEAIAVRVIKRGTEILADQREELARRIINALGEAMEKSKPRGKRRGK